MNEIPVVSVIIPTYNRARLLEQTLLCLQAQREAPPYEVLVINDGSTDETAACLQRWAERWPGDFFLLSSNHAGPGAARNVGLRKARGQIVAMLDDDCLPEPDWLRELTAPLLADDNLVGVGGQTLPLEEKNFWSRYQDLRTMRRPHEDQTGITFVITNNAAFRRDRLLEIGGFDETFVMSAEDVDLSRRLRARGGRLAYQPTAIIRHHNIVSFRGYLKICYRYGQGQVLLHRHYPAWYKILRTAWWSRHLLEVFTLPWKATRFHQGGDMKWGEALVMGLLSCGQETIGFLGALSMLRYIVSGEKK